MVKIDYEELLMKLIERELDALIIAHNLYNVTPHITGKTHPVTLMRNALRSGDRGGAIRYAKEAVLRFMEERRFVAHIFPSIISLSKAKNFYIDKDYRPSEDDVIRYLYLVSSGLSLRYNEGYILFNIDNIDINKWDWIKRILTRDGILVVDRPGSIINYKILARNTAYLPIAPFSLTLLILSYIGINILSDEGVEELDTEILGKYGISSDVYAYLISKSGPKSETYIITRLDRFYVTYLKTRSDIENLLSFLSSLYIMDKEYADLSTTLLDKFIYYLLNGYISGELLDKLILLKIKFELSKPGEVEVYGVRGAREFFGKLRGPVP